MKNSRKITTKSTKLAGSWVGKLLIQKTARFKATTAAVVVLAVAGVGVLVYLGAHASGVHGYQNGVSGNWCMHDINDTATYPDPVNVRNCSGLATQEWNWNGYVIKNTALSTRCLQPKDGKTAVDTTIEAASCNGSQAQEWRRDGSSLRFRNLAASQNDKANWPNGVCLAVPGSDTSHLLSLRPCDPSFKDQDWAGVSPDPIYKNPLRAANFSRSRIDEGVDYGGSGPIKFIGRAKVVEVYRSSGWPGGNFIVYRLLEGDDAGRFVYVAEDCTPAHDVGDTVYGPSDTVCNMYKGSTGIETGWAVPPSQDLAMAHNEYVEGMSTSYGRNFSSLMHMLGSPDATGSLTNNISSLSVPDDWPKW